MGAGPVMGECAAEVGVCVFGILEVFDEGRVAVAFHLLEMGCQLQVDVEVAPVVVPYLDLAEPFFDAQAFERSLEIQVLVDLLDRCLELDDGIPEVRKFRLQVLEVVPLFQQLQQQVEPGVVLVLVAEVVDVLDLLVEFDPVGTFEMPVASEQVVAEYGTFLVSFLVCLQFEECVDQVQELGVGVDGLGLADDLHEALARSAVAFRKTLERNVLAFGEVVARVLDVFVDGVVGVNVRGLPAVPHPLVARFGEVHEGIPVGGPVVAAQLPVFERRRFFVKVVAQQFEDVDHARQEYAGGEESGRFHFLDNRGEFLGAFCSAA